MIDEMRARAGTEIRPSEPPFTSEFNADAIRHFAYGCGDPNPIFSSEEYASTTPHGTRIAPPCALFAQGVGTLMVTSFGLPGLHALYMGTEFWNHRPIKLGD